MGTPEGIIHLGNRKVEILIPSRRKDGSLLDDELIKEWEGKARKKLETLFGGASPTEVTGSFVHEDGRTTRESIIRLVSSCDESKLANHKLKNELFAFSKEICKAMGQEYIFMGWGDAAFLIEEKFDNADVPVIPFAALQPEAQDKFLTLGWGGIDSPEKIRQVLSLDGWSLEDKKPAIVEGLFTLAAEVTDENAVRRAWVYRGDLSKLGAKKADGLEAGQIRDGDLVFATGQRDYIQFGMVSGKRFLGPKNLQQSHVRLNPVTRHLLFQILKRDWNGLQDSLNQKSLDQRFFPTLQKLRQSIETEIVKSGLFKTTADPHVIPVVAAKSKRKGKKDNTADASPAFRESVLLTGRMMFLRFLAQKRGCLEGGTDRLIDAFQQYQDDYFSSYVAPLWFDVLDKPAKERAPGTLSTYQGTYAYLNGGLFNPRDGERNLKLPGCIFDPNQRGSFLQLFRDYEFTINEYAGSDETLKVDPSFFGKALEGFNSRDEKKKHGVHYTPKPIAWAMAAEGILERLSILTEIPRDKLDQAFQKKHKALSSHEAEKVMEALSSFRIFDPAVGSGVLLWACLQVMLEIDSYCDGITSNNYGYAQGSRKWGNRSRHFVINCLYGADISEEAVELCRLRLWLAVALSESDVQPLPDLELNIVSGDSLRMDFKGKTSSRKNQKELEYDEIYRLENENKTLWTAFSNAVKKPERQKEIRNEIFSIRGKLAALDPDRYAKSGPIVLDLQFPHVFGDSGKQGFDLVIANPPYIRIQGIDKALKNEYTKRWSSLGEGSSDLLYAFVELALKRLAAPECGQIAFIQTNFSQIDAARPLRKILAGNDSDCPARTRLWVDFGDGKVFPTATNYTAMLFAERVRGAAQPHPFIYSNPPMGCWEKPDGSLDWLRSPIPIEHPPSHNWLTVPFELKQRVLDCQARAKCRLGDLVDISVGIQTSADDVLLFDSIDADADGNTRFFNKSQPEKIELEPGIIRRCVKGSKGGGFHLLFPYDSAGKLLPEPVIRSQFPLAWKYLLSKRETLENREKGAFKGKGWYRFGRAQGFDACFIAKVLVSSILKEMDCFVDAQGEWAFTGSGNGGGGAIALIPKENSNVDLKEIETILNTREAWDHIQAYGSFQQSGWRGIDKKVIASIPVMN